MPMKKLILFISIVCIVIGNSIFLFNNMSLKSSSLKSEVSTFLNELSEGLSIQNGELFIDNSILSDSEYMVGNTDTVFLINKNKSFIEDGFDKNELFKLRSEFVESKYIIYVGNDGIQFNNKLGYGEFFYKDINSKSNIISGSDFLSHLNINEYIFLNITVLIVDLGFKFLGFLLYTFSLLSILYYVLFCYKKK